MQIFFELGFFLLMLNLLEHLGLQLLTGFGLFGPLPGLDSYLSPLLNMVGVALYLRLRMNRNIDYARLSFEHGWALPLGIGTLLGLGLALTAASVGVLLGAPAPSGLLKVVEARSVMLGLADALLVLFLQVLAVEMVHRGFIANRVEEEFPYWKAIGFAMLFWALSYGFNGMVRWLPLGDVIGNGLLYLFSVLLFWRTENLWWPVAVQFGHFLAFRLFFYPLPGMESGWAPPHPVALWVVWAAACGALLYMDWRDQGQSGVGPGGGGRRRMFRSTGRMVRGPWH